MKWCFRRIIPSLCSVCYESGLKYPRGDFTIIEDDIIVRNENIDSIFDKLVKGFQSNKYKIAEESEILEIEKPNYLKIYGFDREKEFFTKTGERYVEASLDKNNDEIAVHIRIDSISSRAKNKKIISDKDIFYPLIIRRISIDLTDSIDPELNRRLFPKRHIEIIKFEDRLIWIFIAVAILSYIFVENMYYWFLLFGLIGIYGMYFLIDLIRNK